MSVHRTSSATNRVSTRLTAVSVQAGARYPSSNYAPPACSPQFAVPIETQLTSVESSNVSQSSAGNAVALRCQSSRRRVGTLPAAPTPEPEARLQADCYAQDERRGEAEHRFEKVVSAELHKRTNPSFTNPTPTAEKAASQHKAVASLAIRIPMKWNYGLRR